VIVAGRDVERTRAAVPGAAAALRVDLTDLADVARFTGELASHGPLDGVVCNAGVQNIRASFTRDGFEETFGVNHLAHFAIAMRVIPQLAPGARLAWIGSSTFDPRDAGARRFGFRGGRYTDAATLAKGEGDPAASVAQRGRDAYATSKLCNVLTAAAIARRVSPSRLSAFAFDPGLMPGTGLARSYSPIMRLLWNTVMHAASYLMPGASSARRSGRALAWLMTTPSLAGSSGRYFDYRRRELTDWYGVDHADWGDELYAGSLALCGLTDPLA
jgi:NAD(P)-dependent dehydrogenase (short-subunit alcohol dehydrogenase family)